VIADQGGHSYDAPAAFDNLHDWVLSLPWVVERRSILASPSIRAFAIDCRPLARKQMWLVTGLGRGVVPRAGDVSVILPSAVAETTEREGLAVRLVPMPRGHVLLAASDAAASSPRAIEALVLRAYGHAMS
jgi:hypothetical protein